MNNNAMLLCYIEQGAGRNTTAFGVKAGRILLIGFGMGIFPMEAADAMVEVTTVFTQSFYEGKSDVAPVVIANSDVGA